MVYREMKAKLSSEIIVKQKVGQHPHINVTDNDCLLYTSKCCQPVLFTRCVNSILINGLVKMHYKPTKHIGI